MRLLIAVPLLLTLNCGGPADRGIVKREGKADVHLVEKAEPAMTQAIAQARGTMPEFLTTLQTPNANQSGFAVKYPFEEGGRVEHMWVSEVSYDGSVLRGVLNNHPKDLHKLKAGDPVEVSPAQVSDWMYVEDGRLVGGYTLRVMVRNYTAEEKRELEESLGFRFD
jgi:uncharacterized protein YegJ (DUF2314 family)